MKKGLELDDITTDLLNSEENYGYYSGKIEAWEKATRFSVLIRANGKWSEAIVDKHYERALAWCDCIQHLLVSG